jgi:polyphosphate glucokinase
MLGVPSASFRPTPTCPPRRWSRGSRSHEDWSYDVVSVGYPGPVVRNRPLAEPYNLGRGWAGFNFEKAFGRPTKVVNDALMQALGSYEGGKMLFLGLGTGLGSAMIVDGVLEPMEPGHLPYRKGGTFEDFVGAAGLKRHGKKKRKRSVDDVVKRLIAALEPEYVVLGGGNADKVGKPPHNARLGNNGNAFEGGFRLWRDRSIKSSRARGERTPWASELARAPRPSARWTRSRSAASC